MAELASRLDFAAFTEGFSRLSVSRKLGLGVGIAAAIALIVGVFLWSSQPEYKVLFSNLSGRDGGAVIDALTQLNVPFKTAEGGGAILVPSDQVYDVRFRLASQGLPRGGNIGFELMETQKFGMSQFQEQVQYQRALAGELARSIESLTAVEGARVHLAIPKPTVFARERQKPSASVVIKLFPGRAIEPGQVAGIQHLVASGVPEMPLSGVSVVDHNGNLLTSPERRGSSTLDPSQRDLVRQMEQDFATRIERILAPMVGTDNVRAQVTADLDFAEVEQTSETFRPNANPQDASIRSQQSSESGGAGGGNSAAGIPGALSNQPPGPSSAPLTAQGAPGPNAPPGAAGAGGAGGGAREQTINYELDKTIRHVRQPTGTIKRLSAAVVVNYRGGLDKDGKPLAAKPLTPQEMTQVNNLVKEALGFSAQRGDTVNVVNAAFTAPPPPEETPLWKDPDTLSGAKSLFKNLILWGLVFYLVFGVLRPLLRDLAKPPEPVAGEAGATAGEAGAEGEEGGAHVTLSGYEKNLQTAKDMSKQDPALVAGVVKEWVAAE
jgi:flagellar M-ring protein FliF